MKELELLVSIMERALPYLEKRMSESPQPELVKVVTDIHDFLASYYDYT